MFRFKNALALLLCVASLLTCASMAPAQTTSEYALLGKIPKSVLDHIAFDAKPDANGAMQTNVRGWTSVVYQRIAIPLIWTGAVENDSSKVDEAWPAVDLALRHQHRDGSFATGDGKAMPPTDMSLWLEALCHSILILQESPLREQYAGRIASYRPMIRSAIAWLSEDRNLAILQRGDELAVNRLLIDATTFLTASLVLGDPSLRAHATKFLGEALKHQAPNGTLLEIGGFDSSYQGVSLLHGTYYALRADDPALRAALVRALRLELASIDASGNVDVSRNTRTRGQERVAGHVKTPDLRSIILGLYYSGLYLGNERAVRTAEKIYTATFHLSPNG